MTDGDMSHVRIQISNDALDKVSMDGRNKE